MENPFIGERKAEIAHRLRGVDIAIIEDYVEDAWAKALAVAPALASDEFPSARFGQVEGMLTRVMLRWRRGGERDLTASEISEFQRLGSRAATFADGPHSHVGVIP